jgi:DNA-binding transcriptional ArsR family regulator
MATRTRRSRQRGKSIEEAVGYAVSHRTRVLVLVVLAEDAYTASQVAEIIEEPLNNVSNHIRELLDAGSIEIVKTEQKGNVLQHYYRAGLVQYYYSEEDVAAMSLKERHILSGYAVQAIVAELMAGLWEGKMTDPQMNLSTNWFNVDEEGRRAISEEQERSWQRFQEIEAESMKRRAVSGDETRSIVVGQMGFERARKAPKLPLRSPNGEQAAPSD